MNKKLGIVIPTYQRSEILKENFILMLEEVHKYSIPVFISDDSKDSKTEEWVCDLKRNYSHITYVNNFPSLGHDKNLVNSLKLLSTDYVWLLGDSILIKEGSISKLLNVIDKSKCDIISINIKNRDINFPSDSYNDPNEILSKFGWHLTLTGATIFSRKAISFIPKMDFTKYRNFPQFSLIYNYLALHCSFYWINDVLIYSNKNKKSYWIANTFEVFIDDWSKAVHNLPTSYTISNKEMTIINHSVKSKMFNLATLMQLRSLRYYNWDVYRNYADVLSIHSKLKNFVLLIIAIFPPWIIFFIKKIKKNN